MTPLEVGALSLIKMDACLVRSDHLWYDMFSPDQLTIKIARELNY